MTQHTKAIEELCKRDPALVRTGMRQAVREQLTTESGEPPLVPWDEVQNALAIVPDAYKIVGHELHCFEVADTSIMTKARRGKYGLLWHAFDTWDGVVRLFVSDVHGSSYEANLPMYFLADSVQRET